MLEAAVAAGSACGPAPREVTFEVPGTPHAKQRPRATRRGIMFTPKETVNAETFIRLIASPHFPAPLTGPVAIDVTAIFQPPKSWSGVKIRRSIGAPHCQRPDLDNLQKTVGDALNGVAYVDDAQVAEFACRKLWGRVAKTVVTIRPIGAAADLFGGAA